MVGEEVNVNQTKDGTIKWKVLESVIEADMIEVVESEQKLCDDAVSMCIENNYDTLSSAF